ncbi:reverse transcriptase domain-containing protein [Tanacetum coccineum]
MEGDGGPDAPKCSLKAKIAEEDTGNQGPKSKSQALRKTTCLNHGCGRKLVPSHPGSATLCSQKRPRCYDRSDDPKDHLKNFQAATKFDNLPPESVDSYDDLKKAFLANFLQQKKCTKDPVEIHHIKQKEGESTEEFVQRFKAESRHVKGAPECMRIFRFMHAITNPELIKRLHDKIPKSVDEMMRVTTSFLRGEVATFNQARKKALLAWKQQEPGKKQNFDKRGDFRNQQRSERRHDKFTLLTKSPKEILALDKGKLKTPPPMTTPTNRRTNQGWKVVTCNQGAKTGERKRSAEGGKKRRSFWEGQSYCDPNGPAMAKGGQTKDLIKLLPRHRNFIPTARR